MRTLFLILMLCLVAVAAPAQDRLVRLHAPQELADTGLLKYILPRFSLKTQIRVELVPDTGHADMILGSEGNPLFQDDGIVWHVAIQSDEHPGAQRLYEWLNSDIGTRTIFGYSPDGTPLFSPPAPVAVTVAEIAVNGDADLGYRVSRSKCGRCHAVDEGGRKNDIGSTPSFFLLRALPDWQERFVTFYYRNPHPSFTQVEDVTPPFPKNRPPPIVPIEMTIAELEAVLAFVAGVEAADLGAPLVHQ